jgi:putative SOS response-associated peptidase YedK
MPVILEVKDYNRFLDPAEQPPKKPAPLLVPYQGEDLTAYPISARVNSPRNQGPQCIEPMGTGGQTHNEG